MGERIVLGLGDNIDYEIAWDSGIFENLIRQYRISDAELDSERPVSTLRDLVVSILGFVKAGKGGERFVASPDVIEDFSSLFEKKTTLGGTSIRAAIAMRKLGYTSALHLVTMNDAVRRLMPPGCSWVSSAQRDSSYPHLIVQYNSGSRVDAGDISLRASRADRIIYVNDRDNMLMELNPELAELAVDAKVFLISGFNAMRDLDLFSHRAVVLRKIMEALPAEASVFYEDACFHDPALNVSVRAALQGAVDIHSLNEDEVRWYVGRNVDVMAPAAVLDAIAELRRMLRVPTVVVHTRRWAAVFGPNARDYGEALRGGVAMATTRLRFGDDFTAEEYAETASLPPDEAAAAFAAELERAGGDRILCLPSYRVRETELTTIGLGDAFVGGFLPALAADPRG